MSSSSSLSCICISFSWSSINCCKVSLGGITMEAISSIILSLLDKSVPRGCLENFRKIEFIRLTVEFNRNFSFLAIYYSFTSAEEGPTKDNREKTILHRTKYKKVCRIFYLPAEYFNISHNPNWRDCLFIRKIDSNIYVLDLTRLNLVHDLLIKCEGNRTDAGPQIT